MNNKTNRYSYQFRRPFYSSFHKSNIFVTVFLNKQNKKKSMKENEHTETNVLRMRNQFNIDGIINGNVFCFPTKWLKNHKKKHWEIMITHNLSLWVKSIFRPFFHFLFVCRVGEKNCRLLLLLFSVMLIKYNRIGAI